MKIHQQSNDGLFAERTDSLATEQRGANKKRAMNTTRSDFYHRLTQRRDAARRRASFLERLLWRWR